MYRHLMKIGHLVTEINSRADKHTDEHTIILLALNAGPVKIREVSVWFLRHVSEGADTLVIIPLMLIDRPPARRKVGDLITLTRHK